MNASSGYSLTSYGHMILASSRMQAYADALKNAITPGCTVLDLGAATGIFSLLACQYGAGHVHAVEPDNSILLGPSMAKANGYEGRISFHQTLSTRLTLDQPADVVISDLRGVMPLFEMHIPAILDARQRLLAPGGTLIPRADTIHGALVQSPELYRDYHEPWVENAYGLNLSAAHGLVTNTWKRVRVKPEELLTHACVWATLDYRTIEHTDIAATLSFVMDRPGTAHGLAMWFDGDLGNGRGFSNAPDEQPLVYAQAFFPLQSPVELVVGDRIALTVRANLVGGDYIWSWDTLVTSAAGKVKANLRQSTFYGSPLSPALLKFHQPNYVPTPSSASEVEMVCLGLIDGKRTLGDIAQRLHEQFPQRFMHLDDALTYASSLLERLNSA